jgi:uncharacterized protein
MYIIRNVAANWNKFGWYDTINDNNPVSTWQIDPMPVWGHSLNPNVEYEKTEIGKKYKNSVFNIHQRFERNDVVYNTASEAVIILNERERHDFDDFIDSSHEMNEELLSALVNLGIVVSVEDDEFTKIHFIRKRAIYSQNSTKNFVIYPTHECNARCFYCFAQEDTKTNKKMSLKVADESLQYIYKQINPNDEVVFRWFGGEPLMAVDIIDHIVNSFNSHFNGSIKYHSIITSNVSLFTDELIFRAQNKWNLKKVLVPLDGFQTEHNKRKNYYTKKVNQYEVVLKNIQTLLNNGIHVVCRLNLDHNNFGDIDNLFDDLSIFKDYENFFLHVTTLHVPPHAHEIGNYIHYREFNDFYSTVFEQLFKRGFHKDIAEIIPRRMMSACTAMMNNHSLINADGNLFRCEQEEHSIQNSVGCCRTGIVHNDNLRKWIDADVEAGCQLCQFLPICQGGCKHYRFRNNDNITPCTRAKYYCDALMTFINQWYEERILPSVEKRYERNDTIIR